MVEELPVEVVPGNAQHDLLTPIRIDQLIRHVLSAQMHVRHHLDEFGVGQEFQIHRWALVVGFVRRNGEIRPARRDAVRHPAFLPRAVSDTVKPMSGRSTTSLPIRRVMNLDRNVRVGRNQLAGAERSGSRRHCGLERSN